MRRFLVAGLLVLSLVPVEAEASFPTRNAVVERVIDGDTFVTRNGTKIRLIGVDTPEVFFGAECYGPEASAFTKSWLVKGDRIRLEFDVERKDRYGRTLAYVYEGRKFFNWVLVRRGYALAKKYPPNVRYHSMFLAAQKKAAAENRGLWGACGGQK